MPEMGTRITQQGLEGGVNMDHVRFGRVMGIIQGVWQGWGVMAFLLSVWSAGRAFWGTTSWWVAAVQFGAAVVCMLLTHYFKMKADAITGPITNEEASKW